MNALHSQPEAVVAAACPPIPPVVLVRDRLISGSGLEVGVHDGSAYVFDDGGRLQRDGDTLQGHAAEFLTHTQLAQRLTSLQSTEVSAVWAENLRLKREAEGPDGHLTWKDAALEERLRRVAAQRESDALSLKLNTPELHDFAAGVVLEAAHQRLRWAARHDAGKQPEDWFWLLGYLGGKALSSAKAGDTDKARHHTISSAAALANWHASMLGIDTSMRPGIDPVARGLEPTAEG